MKTMKSVILLVAFAVTMNIAFAVDKYTETMQKNIQTVYTASSIAELQSVVNAFERIASAEKTKWEPYYYAAFGNIMMATRESDGVKKDAYLDLALTAIENAKAIDPKESELAALEGFVHMIRVTVDPATRGQKFSGMAFQSFGKARALNPENPRALALTAQMELGTAKFFNSSTADACKTNATAVEKFSTYKSSNPLAPQWGREMADAVAKDCK